MLQISISVFDQNNEKVDALSKSPCHPQLLNSILSLCEPGFRVEILFEDSQVPGE